MKQINTDCIQSRRDDTLLTVGQRPVGTKRIALRFSSPLWGGAGGGVNGLLPASCLAVRNDVLSCWGGKCCGDKVAATFPLYSWRYAVIARREAPKQSKVRPDLHLIFKQNNLSNKGTYHKNLIT
jgi:hypothetical protein